MKTAHDSCTRLGKCLGMALLSLGVVGCSDEVGTRATARLLDTQGAPIGTVTFRMIDEGVLLGIDASGLPPGERGFHVHERGECAPPSFESAGDHFDVNGHGHGFLDREGRGGAHAGDLLNLVVDDSGRAWGYQVLERATLDRNAPAGSASLLREGGTAIVIHAQPDDYRTDPAGGAGERIACGVIEADSGSRGGS